MAKPTPGDYLVKLRINKNGSWQAQVVGRWSPNAKSKGDVMVDASKTTQEAVRSWAALRLP